MKSEHLNYTDTDLRKRRRIWRTGIVSLAILTAVCIGWAVWRIPQDIGARTIEALHIAGLDPRVAVAVDGRNLTLSGEVHDVFDRARMTTLAGSIRGVRGVVDRLNVSPIEPLRALPSGPAPAPPAPVPGPAPAGGPAPRGTEAVGPPVAAAAPTLPAPPPAGVAPAVASSPASASLALQALRFSFNSARLTAENESVLWEVVDALRKRPEVRIELAGHADGIGSSSYNQRLSARRAEAVARWLVSAGIDPPRLQTRGYGETQPRADNLTRKGRALNRRVEFTLLK